LASFSENSSTLEFLLMDQISPVILQALGGAIVSYARVEALLAEFLSHLLDANKGAMYVLNQDVASATQLKWIRALVNDKYHREDVRAALSDLFARIDNARIERNSLVHGVWTPGAEPATALVQTVKLDRPEMIRNELITVPDIDDLFGDLVAIGDELYAILDAIGVFPK
jgi:hypothetical protein